MTEILTATDDRAMRQRVAAAVINEAGHGLIEWLQEDILVLHGHGKERPDFIIDAVNENAGVNDGWQLEKIEASNNQYRLVRF